VLCYLDGVAVNEKVKERRQQQRSILWASEERRLQDSFLQEAKLADLGRHTEYTISSTQLPREDGKRS
jgi:hypothetical protein